MGFSLQGADAIEVSSTTRKHFAYSGILVDGFFASMDAVAKRSQSSIALFATMLQARYQSKRMSLFVRYPHVKFAY